MIKFGDGEVCLSVENQVIASGRCKIYDFLIFIDSRGLVSIQDHSNSYVKLQMKYLKIKKLNYLIVSRPKNLTIFATLYNFLKINIDLKFKKLITNLGFVDFTPKKESNIRDNQIQLKKFFSEEKSILQHENYKLSNGEFELLKSIKYSEYYKKKLMKYFLIRFEKLYFLNTPLINKDKNINRERPKSFFKQLEVTNNFLNDLVKQNRKKSKLIDIMKEKITYDGVHYTPDGHLKIFNKIKKLIDV